VSRQVVHVDGAQFELVVGEEDGRQQGAPAWCGGSQRE
jgi:hypothetical protein